MTAENNETDKKYIMAFNSILTDITNSINPSISEKTILSFSDDGSFPGVFTIKDNKIVELKLDRKDSLKILCWQILSDLDDEEEQKVKSLIKNNFSSNNIEFDNSFFESNEDSLPKGLLKDSLPSESDVDDAFDRLLD